jgi:hypothetical protein
VKGRLVRISRGLAVTSNDGFAGSRLKFLTPIDIQPYKPPNYIRLGSEGYVSVVILSTKDVDAATQVDQMTLRFGHSGIEASLRRCKRQSVDVNRDGKPDLICRFAVAAGTHSSVGTTNWVCCASKTLRERAPKVATQL